MTLEAVSKDHVCLFVIEKHACIARSQSVMLLQACLPKMTFVGWVMECVLAYQEAYLLQVSPKNPRWTLKTLSPLMLDPSPVH